MELKQQSLLQGGKYKIERMLGQGGFGITYLGEQTSLGRKVAIKEFFMKQLCNRDEATSHVSVGSEGSREIVSRFREKFVKEARNIAKLNHPYIVRVIDVFEENNTAYYVMEYASKGSLSEKVKKEGALPESIATRYICQVASALDYIHKQKMNHLDVKPANILLNEKDEAILIDFGLSKQYDLETGSQTSTTPVGISHGYAPIEQYKEGGVSEFSPTTDIYSLGATLYKLVTGLTPPEAIEVAQNGVPTIQVQVHAEVKTAIQQAMQFKKENRPQSITMFMQLLEGHNGNNAGVDVEDTFLIKPNESTITNDEEEKNQMKIEQKVSQSKSRSGFDDLGFAFKNYNIITLFILILLSVIIPVFIFFDIKDIIRSANDYGYGFVTIWRVLHQIFGIIMLLGIYFIFRQRKYGFWILYAALASLFVDDSGIEIIALLIYSIPCLFLYATFFLKRNGHRTIDILK